MRNIWAPRLTVAAVIEQDGRFLTVEEEDDDGKIIFNQPAGHVDPEEPVIAATIRETLEETGWLYEPTAIVGIYINTNETTQITYLRVCFAGKLIEHQPEKRFIDEIIACHWMTLDEIVAKTPQHRSPMVLQCIKDYQANKRYPLDLVNQLGN